VTNRARTAAERAHGTLTINGSRALAGLFGRALMRLTVQGREHIPAGGVLLAVNHNSLLDGPLLYGVLPRPATFFIKAEVFTGIVGWYLPLVGQIPVRRGVAERAPLLTALAVLAEGGIVGIFPEGTRRAAGQPGAQLEQDAPGLREVRHGIAYLALRSGCPVVPVACLGTEHVLPKGRTLPAVRRPVTVSIGRPVHVAEGGARPNRQAIAAAASRVRDLLADHLRTTTAAGPPATAPTPGEPSIPAPTTAGRAGETAAPTDHEGSDR
jgi:1-acyl-sn-glycerol-3-phosphate acyltransferase